MLSCGGCEQASFEDFIGWWHEFSERKIIEAWKRTSKGKVLGRDHFPNAYSMVIAGGGVRGGYSHGETDELGFSVARDKVHVHDLQATWMHLLGFDHEKLSYRFQGRDYRLTDVHGRVVRDLLA